MEVNNEDDEVNILYEYLKQLLTGTAYEYVLDDFKNVYVMDIKNILIFKDNFFEQIGVDPEIGKEIQEMMRVNLNMMTADDFNEKMHVLEHHLRIITNEKGFKLYSVRNHADYHYTFNIGGHGFIYISYIQGDQYYVEYQDKIWKATSFNSVFRICAYIIRYMMGAPGKIAY